VRDEDAVPRLRALGFADREAQTLAAHFLDAERRGKPGHGLARVEWLETQGLDPHARPERLLAEEGYERWDGRGALGYLTLAEICVAQITSPPKRARVIVASNCFPTGMLGHWTRKLADDGGLVAALTATSPARLAHPDGGPALVGTNPLSIAVPSSEARPLVVDVSMGRVTYGDVIAGLATEEELVPFGGDRAHKAFALALGLQLLVDALAGEGYGAVMLVARPEADPVPAVRRLAAGVRLPGDSTKA
jgi:LDH2 family malate/lactate/ureidoglycolate dehydrogenase